MLILSKPKLLVYWNVRRVDHHFLDAIWHLNKSFNVTFVGNVKYKNVIAFEDVNPKDYDLFIAYDSGSQTFNLGGNKYDLRANDITGVPKILRVIDTHLRPEEHIKIAENYDMVLYSSPSHAKHFKQNSAWLPMHTDTEFYSVDKGSYYNYKTIKSAIGTEYLPQNFIFEQSTDRYITASFLIKFRDYRASVANNIFNRLPRDVGKCIIAKAFKYAAIYFHTRSKFSLHLQCNKFDNYITWRPLDAMACGAIPIIQRGDDSSWADMFDMVSYDKYYSFRDIEDAPQLIENVAKEYEQTDETVKASKDFDIRLEPRRLVSLALGQIKNWNDIRYNDFSSLE